MSQLGFATVIQLVMHKNISFHSFSVANVSYRRDDEAQIFEYRMAIRSKSRENTHLPVQTWSTNKSFRFVPT
ncbi:MAG: hypothetical protein NT159_23680 [Proteobacteria bacterium]|nr:hypothetical protein [Pseudomonadota bacterium]